MKNRLKIIGLLSLGFSVAAGASKPDPEKSLAACEAALTAGRNQPASIIAPSTLIPLHTLLGSTRCDNVAKLWREGSIFERRFPSPGTLEMFRTAEVAAESIVDNMKTEGAVRPVYNKRDLMAGAAATFELIRGKNPPPYIQQAVLVRDLVYTVVPLLKRIERKNAQTGLPVYSPIIAKGHQELSDFDVLSASFAAWALEIYQGKLPAKAFVYLRAMEKRRKTHDESLRNFFEIDPADYRMRVEQIYSHFVKLVSTEETLAQIEARRCTHCNRCPWAAYCKKNMTEAGDLSMMALPPSPAQHERLKQLGLGTLTALAQLDINSERFFTTAIQAQISPARLRYFVAHALATHENKALIVEKFSSPFDDAQSLVHIDFEDILNGRLISGVYLFGMLLQQAGKDNKPTFIFTQLEQRSIDESWAEFIRGLRDDQALQNEDFLVTVYSAHERTKFEQEFDILKQKPSRFSPQEKASPYYWQSEQNGLSLGRLIRRKEFFQKYPDIKPRDIFVIDRMVDLRDFVRKNFAFPTYSNGLKHVLNYVQGASPKLIYPPGANGFESVAWANKFFKTGEIHIREGIITYNGHDIEANAIISDFLKLNAGQPIDARLRWNESNSERLEQVSEIVASLRVLSETANLEELFSAALGKTLGALSDIEREELSEALDRKDYLASLRDTGHDARNPEIKSERQVLRFAFSQDRSHKLQTVLRKINPAIDEDPNSEAAQAYVSLIAYPSNQLTPARIPTILLYEKLSAQAASRNIKAPRDRWSVPVAWMQALSKIVDEKDRAEAETLWSAFYFKQLFAVGETE